MIDQAPSRDHRDGRSASPQSLDGHLDAKPLAVMAYTVLEPALADLEGTLGRLAELGYLGMETYGIVEHYGPTRVRQALDAAGLALTSAHTPFPAGTEAERLLDQAEELGATSLVWSLEPEEFANAASVDHGVERVNEAAERAAARGMRVVYHNHTAEFTQRYDGQRAYEYLQGVLDPRVVLELDAYWARFGGADLAQVLDSTGDRIHYIHLKDGPLRDYGNDTLVPLGSPDGSIDWGHVLGHGAGLEWHIVELEKLAGDVFEALAQSRDFLVGSGLSRAAGPSSQGGTVKGSAPRFEAAAQQSQALPPDPSSQVGARSASACPCTQKAEA
jgi:sugar phosphate isomerase/epimerase